MNTCVFCQIVDRREPAEIVYEDDLCLVFLDKYPQTRGHLQLIPKKHYSWIYEMPEMGQIFAVSGKLIRAIIPVLKADHVTLATFGRQVRHAHIWIVPQYLKEQEIHESASHQSNWSDLSNLAGLLKEAISKEVF